MPERRKSRLSKALEEALLRNAMTAPGQQVFLEHTPEVRQNLQNFAKGASIALPAGAADLAGMTAMAASQPFAYAGPGAAALSMRAQQEGVNMGGLDAPPMSGNPIREAVGLDINDPWGIAGEVADPSTAATKGFALLLKAGMTALKTGAKMTGVAAAMAPIARVTQRVTRPFKRLPKPQDVTELSRADFIYDLNIDPVPPKTQRIVDVGKRLQEDAKAVWGGRMEEIPENIPLIAENMAKEAIASFGIRPQMAGWYKHNLDEALGYAAEIHPEILTDHRSQTAFKFIMAITSNGQEVPVNAKLTNQYYDLWKQHGRFPVLGSGKEKGAMEKAFMQANELVKDMGFDEFEAFLKRDFTVRELKQAGFNISGENMDTVVKGSSIFGPKIGGGFMQNLMGNFDVPTFDRWFTRTYGRHTGRLLPEQATINKQRDKFKSAIGNKTAILKRLGFEPDELYTMQPKLKADGTPGKQMERVWNDDAVDELAEIIHKEFAKDKSEGKTYSRSSPLRNAARNLDKSLSNVVDDPKTGARREYMREVMREVQRRMHLHGVDVDVADVQALLWYAEKDLYLKLGADVNVDTVDYATVWRDIADAARQ